MCLQSFVFRVTMLRAKVVAGRVQTVRIHIFAGLRVPRYHVACESARRSRANSTLAANSTHSLLGGGL